jgi:hypothetical protein
LSQVFAPSSMFAAHICLLQRLLISNAISDSSQFEWETRTMCFFSPMIYMIIVGRLNADEALLICIHHMSIFVNFVRVKDITIKTKINVAMKTSKNDKRFKI